MGTSGGSEGISEDVNCSLEQNNESEGKVIVQSVVVTRTADLESGGSDMHRENAIQELVGALKGILTNRSANKLSLTLDTSQKGLAI